MLHTRQTNLLPAMDEIGNQRDSNTVFERALEFARRQFWVVLFFIVIALLGAAGFLIVVVPAYTATATMLIDPRKGGVQQKSVLGDAPTDQTWIDSQMGILMLERDQIGVFVTKQLQLVKDRGLADPQENSSGLFGFFQTESDRRSTASEAEIAQRIAGTIAGGLDVKRVGLSYLVNVNFSSSRPDLALRVANAAADAYVVAEMDGKYKNLREASNWLQDRYHTLREQAAAADRAVVEFKSNNNIVTAGGKLINDQQLSEINDRLGAARAKTADAQARLNQIEAVLAADEADNGADATVSDALGNPIINRLRSQYLDLINREADWSKRFGKNHLAVVNVRNQARDIRKSTIEELKRIHETYKSDLEIAKKNETELEKQLASVVSQLPNDAQITLRSLESSAQSYRTFTDNFLLTYTESVQQQSSPIPDTRVVSYATYAYKSYPSTGRVLILALLGGLGLGIGAGMLREIMDRAFRTSRQTRSELQMECLALIPLINADDLSLKQKWFGKARKLLPAPGHPSEMPGPPNLFRLVSDDPFSCFAEAIRAIKLAADIQGGGRTSNVIGLTSSIPREGKSTIAASLAGQIAQVNNRAILVDCDLRNPALSKSLAPQADVGILEVVSGRASLDRAILKDPVTGMAFLPAVNSLGVPNTDQILSSDAMKQLFQLLRSRYQYIVVDLSPLAPIVDVRATADFIDSYVFVVEWGVTKIEVVQQSLQEAPRIYENALGVVLNKVDMDAISRYDGERAYYYTAKYYPTHPTD